MSPKKKKFIKRTDPDFQRQSVLLSKKLRKPDYMDVLDDLIIYTGLDAFTLCEHILLSSEKVRLEVEFVNPQSGIEFELFYRCCREYLFLNAHRPVWKMLKTTEFEDPVLDFAGGMGNDSMWLVKNGHDVAYHDISIIQKDFVKFRTGRHGYEGALDICDEVYNSYNTILLRDILEHVLDYGQLLLELDPHLNVGGIMMEHSPWNNNERFSPLHHEEDKENTLSKVFKKMGYENVQKGVWRKT